MLRPSHRPKRFIAQKVFTDRQDQKALFEQALAMTPQSNDYHVLVFYGVGGQGKTALAKEFVAHLRGQPDGRLGWAALDFDNPTYRQPAEALLAIRLQLRDTGRLRFPAFDFAYARYFALTNPGANIRQRHPELFSSQTEAINDLIGLASDALSVVPGVGLLHKYGTRSAFWIRDWLQRRGHAVLDGLDQLNPSELLIELPKYLGADIFEALFGVDPQPEAAAGRRMVILLDTYEALWRERGLKQGIGALRTDDWVRRLVEEAPGVLFVFLGRERLQWEEVSPDWADVLDQHLLGGLAEADADAFLKAVPIRDGTIRTRIMRASKGVPFYLDLQADHFERLKNQGREPTLEDFDGEGTAIIDRFLDHLNPDEAIVLRVLAHARFFDEALCRHLAELFLGGAARVNFATLRDRSFMSCDAEGHVRLHELMREHLTVRMGREEPKLARQLHEALFKWHDAQANVTDIRNITPSQETAFEEAGYHQGQLDSDKLLDWFLKRARPFYDAGRYGMLIPLYQRALAIVEQALGPDHPDVATTLNNLAELYRAQGKYAEAEPLHQRALAIKEQALGPDHPDVATTLSNLALLYRAQGKYAEAEPLYQRALAIVEQALGPDHPNVITVLQNYAYLLHMMGRTNDEIIALLGNLVKSIHQSPNNNAS